MFQRAQLWSRCVQAAPAVLGLSVLVRMLWVFLLPNGMNLVDLHVYVDGSAALLHQHLYDFTYSANTPGFPLPFTYPPFAAMVFFPLHFVPFTVVAVGWLLATIAALYAIVRITQQLMLRQTAAVSAMEPSASASIAAHHRHVAMLWTTLGMWTEPVRMTLDYGQVNVFLVLGTMLAVRSVRPWLSGGLVGAVAGIKLTPAVTVLYFAARRRWFSMVCAAGAFGASIGLSFVVIGGEASRYFGTLLGDASRIGPVGSVWNQSLRGALSRVVGHDVGMGPVWLSAAAVVAALGLAAWRTLGRDDAVGTLMVVQLFGLVISPISWSHHWVWVVPMMVWLCHGPVRTWRGMRVVLGFWLTDVLVSVPRILSEFPQATGQIARPWALAWLASVDAVGVVLVYGWLIWARRASEPAVRRIGEVAAAAIVVDGKLLLAQRNRPPELAGLWELPGGKVEPGETPEVALRRELREELGIEAVVGGRIGVDVTLPDQRGVLRAYRADIVAGSPAPLDHSGLRWVDAAGLDRLDLVPNDRAWLSELRLLLEPAPSDLSG